MLYVTGTNIWDGERVDIFYSQDMERWQVWNALNLPGYGIFQHLALPGRGQVCLDV